VIDPSVRVRQQLADIPDLYTQLQLFKIPGSAPPDPDARKGSTNPSRPTVRLEVVDLLDERTEKAGSDEPVTRDLELDKLAGSSVSREQAKTGQPLAYGRIERRLGILPTLGLWVMMCRTEMLDQHLTAPRCCEDSDGHTVAGECSWLLDHVDWILEWHKDFAEDINVMHQDLQRVCGIRREKPIPCRACGGKVEGRDNNAWFLCLGCGKSWLWEAELARMNAAGSKMRTLAQIADEKHLSLKMLKNMARTRFLPTGHDRKGVALYDADVVERAVKNMGKHRKRG
jgi:predicted RNA-binding Zn-ribbon protein involved in translation (DUF1610 family)